MSAEKFVPHLRAPRGSADYGDVLDRVVRLHELRALVGLTRSGIYRGIQLGTFPPPIRIGSRAVGWLLREVVQWRESRPRVDYSRLAAHGNQPPFRADLPAPNSATAGNHHDEATKSEVPPIYKGGNRAYDDNLLVDEIRKAVDSSSAKSYNQAAIQIADRIPGGGTLESKAKRIARKASRRPSTSGS